MQKIYSLQYLRAFAALGVGNVYVVAVLSFILTLLASAAIYLLIEKRFINYAKQLINRRNKIK